MRSIINLDLTPFNSYKIKAFCAKAFFPETEEEILKIYSQNPGRKIIILGNGNNIILTKEYYEDYFLILNGNFNKIEVNGNELVCEAGASMLRLSEIALDNKLTGMEIFYDIPGSVGGAIVMNAGASGEEIKDLLVKVRYLDLEGMEVKEGMTEDFEFEYRNCFFQKHSDKIVLKAWFMLNHGDFEAIKGKMVSIKITRWAKQPRDYPNCGSVFKRPEGHYVGQMLDELGLKGFTIGDAQISNKHSGFIINLGNATGEDILAIIKEAQKRVWEKFKIQLDIEQRVI